VSEAARCHLNWVVCDTQRWEQSAAFFIDTHPVVAAFVKNAGLGFAIPYLDGANWHDYVPDFVVRLCGGHHMVLEVKGYDPLKDVKKAAAERWARAVSADGRYGKWSYTRVERPGDVVRVLGELGVG
jgi:type III restriction enzyme